MSTADVSAKKPLLERLGLHRRELRAWAMYDWANSAFVTTIVTAVYPVYFRGVAGAGLPEGAAAQRHAIATTIGLAAVAILAPILGAIADSAPVKKRFLGGFLLLGVVATAGLFFVYRGDWLLGACLFVLAQIGASGSFVFYDALLPHIARSDEIDRVSTAGYALGYLGGGVLLALNLAWILKPGWFGLPSGSGLPARLAFLSVAVWWFVFSIPLFLRVSEPPVRIVDRSHLSGNMIRKGFLQLAETMRELRRFRNAFLMLLAYLVYHDGIGTIIAMAAIYGAEIGLPDDALLIAILLVQFLGIPFTFLFGPLAGRIGTRASIYVGLAVYTAVTVIAYFMSQSWHFFALAVLIALVQGGTQALSRSLFASLIPTQRSAEFFGFFALSEKFAGLVGPAVFALAIHAFGSSRMAVLSVAGFLIGGAVLLAFVRVDEGRRIAREATEELARTV